MVSSYIPILDSCMHLVPSLPSLPLPWYSNESIIWQCITCHSASGKVQGGQKNLMWQTLTLASLAHISPFFLPKAPNFAPGSNILFYQVMGIIGLSQTMQFSASQPPHLFLWGVVYDLIVPSENFCKGSEKVCTFLIQGRDADGARAPSFFLLATNSNAMPGATAASLQRWGNTLTNYY